MGADRFVTPDGNLPPAAKEGAATRIDRVADWLLLGGAVAPGDYARLRRHGVTHVIDLRQQGDVDADPALLARSGVAWRHVPIPNDRPPTNAQLEAAAAWVESSAKAPVVYVHCGGGIGRAPTMAAGLLIRQGWTPDDAIRRIRTVRPEIQFSGEQLAWLRSSAVS